jgi:hypothetical protein
VGWTLRSRRPHACGEVLCAEPGRPHAARSRDERSRASRGSSNERSPAGRHEESDDCIVPRKPRTKPSDIGGGDGGGKAVGRRKGTSLRMSRTQSRNWHVTEAARPRIGAAWAAQAPMADRVRPSTGARCVSSARRICAGGSGVTCPPTATSGRFAERLHCGTSRCRWRRPSTASEAAISRRRCSRAAQLRNRTRYSSGTKNR